MSRSELHKSVGIFSLEMSKEQLVKRLLCAESRIDAHRVNTGYLNKEDWNRLSRASGDLSETRIFIDDTASITIPELRSKARRLSLEHGLDLDHRGLSAADVRIHPAL